MEDIPQSAQDMKDILDIQDIVLFSWPKVLSLVLGILVLVVLFFLAKKIFGIIKNRKENIPSLPPLAHALKRLSKINMTKTNPRILYFELSKILREYLEQAHSFSAMEKSTTEIREMLLKNKPNPFTNAITQELISFFDKADQIKFAGRSADIEEMKGDMGMIQKIITQLDSLLQKS